MIIKETLYAVNEIFYSIQGEGHFSGTPAIFLRLSGCNLACPFCDTKHQEARQMTGKEIIKAISDYPTHHLVITGGEPTLQIDNRLINHLHHEGYFVQIETNGTHPYPDNADWVTCSPKANSKLDVWRVHELKMLYPFQIDPDSHKLPIACEYRLQPLDTGDAVRNQEILNETINYILDHPKWKLSLQTHKIINVR